MIVVNIHEVKARLCGYLRRVARGETVVVRKRNKPIAEIRGLPAARRTRRPIGLDKGRFTVSPSFFEPLPPGLLAAFEGEEGRRA